MNINSDKAALLGFGLAALIALTPARAAETLFDNGSAIDNAGQLGGTGYSTNQGSGWQVYDNFSFSRDLSIESVWFQMAGGTEPFEFSVYADDDGKPGMKIFSTSLEVGDYSFSNFRRYRNGTLSPDPGHDFSFDLSDPLTLPPGDYWVSFWGTNANRFYTLGTGSGDGFLQKSMKTDSLYPRRGNTPFRLIGQPVDAALAAIDIKPGSNNNPVNPKSNGVIPVAVLGSIDFDATQVNHAKVSFGANQAQPVHDGHVEDIDGDGFMDMVFHFKTRDTGIECGDTEALLNGATFAGEEFSAIDSIVTVGCKNPDANGDIMDEPLQGDVIEEETDDTEQEGDEPAAAAIDWSMLALTGLLALLALYRQRGGGFGSVETAAVEAKRRPRR